MIETRIFGIAYQCPFVDRKEDCPFYLMDAISFHERVELINGLCEPRKRKIIDWHTHCLLQRENKEESKVD